MNIALWALQGFLAAMFGLAGLVKTTQPIDKLKQSLTWANRFPPAAVRFVGISELLGGIGLVLPWALHFLPILTPISAAALALVMLLAIFHHLRHNERPAIAMNVGLLLAAAIIAYGRFSEVLL